MEATDATLLPSLREKLKQIHPDATLEWCDCEKCHHWHTNIPGFIQLESEVLDAAEIWIDGALAQVKEGTLKL